METTYEKQNIVEDRSKIDRKNKDKSIFPKSNKTTNKNIKIVVQQNCCTIYYKTTNRKFMNFLLAYSLIIVFDSQNGTRMFMKKFFSRKHKSKHKKQIFLSGRRTIVENRFRCQRQINFSTAATNSLLRE
jgi:hypothetical protein